MLISTCPIAVESQPASFGIPYEPGKRPTHPRDLPREPTTKTLTSTEENLHLCRMCCRTIPSSGCPFLYSLKQKAYHSHEKDFRRDPSSPRHLGHYYGHPMVLNFTLRPQTLQRRCPIYSEIRHPNPNKSCSTILST